MYDVAINAFTTNQPEAIDLLVKFADKYSGSGNAEAVMLKLGNHYFAEKNYESAEKYYSEYIKKYSGNPIYGLNAYCGLGGIYEEQGEFAKAGELYESFVAKYKDSTFLPMMRLNAGKAYYSAGENESARDNFNVIINEFGNSQENQEALFYLEMISNGTTGA